MDPHKIPTGTWLSFKCQQLREPGHDEFGGITANVVFRGGPALSALLSAFAASEYG
jgi:hypothetical protein